MRICSLLPSATEIVASLGLVESLVAVSEECDWPPEVRTGSETVIRQRGFSNIPTSGDD
jgi:iron complex transport system substrate-binding protein